MADRGTIERKRAGHILAWFIAAGVLWLAGAFADGTRALAAVAGGARDRLQRLRWSPTGCPAGPPARGHLWKVQAAHFAERFQLFVIIALGETIVLTGAVTAELAARRGDA